jgi:hypothetical protein
VAAERVLERGELVVEFADRRELLREQLLARLPEPMGLEREAAEIVQRELARRRNRTRRRITARCMKPVAATAGTTASISSSAVPSASAGCASVSPASVPGCAPAPCAVPATGTTVPAPSTSSAGADPISATVTRC